MTTFVGLRGTDEQIDVLQARLLATRWPFVMLGRLALAQMMPTLGVVDCANLTRGAALVWIGATSPPVASQRYAVQKRRSH